MDRCELSEHFFQRVCYKLVYTQVQVHFSNSFRTHANGQQGDPSDAMNVVELV